jgi:oligoendopeptidase F
MMAAAFLTTSCATTPKAAPPPAPQGEGAKAEGVKKVAERGEIEAKYLWNLESTFKDVQEWEKEYAAVDAQVAELAKLQGTLGKGAGELLATLKLRDEVSQRLERVYVYANLLNDQDTRVGANQALEARARSLAIKYGQATAWMEPELTAVPFETIDGWMKQSKDLALYRHAFENLFRQKQYVLPTREEELIAMAGEVFAAPATTYSLFANADMQFPTIKDENGQPFELSDSVFYKCVRSPERRVRKEGYEGIAGSYAKFRNTAASLLNGAVQAHIFNVRARGYENCLTASLTPGNIPKDVYNTLIKTVNDNLPLLHRYTSLRKKVLKLNDGVHDYDLYCPFVSKAKLEYSYEEGVKTIGDALAPLGDEYLKPMNKGFASRWVDVYTTKGKKSGAYSSGTFLTQPYILLNFFGEYDDVSTLGHEMGHSMHSYFSRGTQPYVYADYDIFCAEVASTCNEILLQKYILPKIKDPQTKLYLLCELLESVRGTVFRQTMFSEFEQRIHELAEKGVPLTADALGAAYGEIMKKYYGPDYAHDPLVDNYWIRIPHFYYNFYVYKYATSFCAASNIARRIMDKEPGAVEKYLRFLKSGSSKYAIELLRDAGVDMTTPAYIQDAMKNFKALLDQTEELAAQVNK